MIHRGAILRAFLPFALVTGCGTTGEIDQTPVPAPPPTTAQPAPRLEFETKVDTIDALHGDAQSRVPNPARELQIKFMVQVGAFRDPHLATAIQLAARERYHLPVLNDYHMRLGLYQIRIGFFETRREALVFRDRMRREFPGDYGDAWVVQLKR